MGLERVVNRCLEKDPRQRFQTARDIYNELRYIWNEVKQSGCAPIPPAHQVAPTAALRPDSRDTVASIAVLPFVNRSASADDEYFSDGLADELLNVLSKIKGLRVTARSSAFTFKGRQVSASEIGRTLGVATILEGSVRKAGNRIRVSVQLVNVADSSHLWSGTYDRTLEDIFAVQDDISKSVVKELRWALLGFAADSDASEQTNAEVTQATWGRGTNPEAFRLLLLARHLLNRRSHEETETALSYLQMAVEIDPNFALAWAELGMAHIIHGDGGWTPVSVAYESARKAAKCTLALAPKLPEGLALMGWIQASFDRDFEAAQLSYSLALEFAPGNSRALLGMGVLSETLGRTEEAIKFYRRALERDPLRTAAHINLGLALSCSSRFLEAEAAFRSALEITPQTSFVHADLALTLLALGRGDEALTEALREPEEWSRLQALAILHHSLGHGVESDEALKDLIEKYAEGYAYQVAEVYGARAEVDHAFEWLERAYARRDSGLSEVKSSRFLRSLSGDVRWGEFLRKLGLQD